MSNNLILKSNPRIEFQLQSDGFQLVDDETQQNTGYYAYKDIQSVDVNKAWFPTLAKWLRGFTWILNMGVPFFPDAKSYKKANLLIQLKNTKFGIWLTDVDMADRAKRIKEVLDEKTNH
jgi:hypothetical protein